MGLKEEYWRRDKLSGEGLGKVYIYIYKILIWSLYFPKKLKSGGGFHCSFVWGKKMLNKTLHEYYYQHCDYFSKCIKNNINPMAAK